MESSSSKTNLNRPIIGVFISNHHIHKLNKHIERFKTSGRYIRYIELVKANQEMKTTLYFFSNKNVDFVKNEIIGTYFDTKKEQWKKKNFPIPDVLYDKGGGGGKIAEKIRVRFKDLGVKSINGQHYFDKWDVYDRLKGHKNIQAHLPKTIKGEGIDDVQKALQHSIKIYVKARKGSRGKKVMRIIKKKNDTFQLSYCRHDEACVQNVKTMTDLAKIIQDFFQGTTFIIQEAIDLIQVQQCIVDLRGELQKDGEGKLKIAGISVRIGRPHSPIASNTLKTHYYPFDTFFKEHMKLSVDEIANLKRQSNRFLLKVYRCIEKVYGSFGEMGIDFGLDKNGKLWFIECNAKSAKSALYNAFDATTIKKAFSHPLQYAKYLADYP